MTIAIHCKGAESLIIYNGKHPNIDKEKIMKSLVDDTIHWIILEFGTDKTVYVCKSEIALLEVY